MKSYIDLDGYIIKILSTEKIKNKFIPNMNSLMFTFNDKFKSDNQHCKNQSYQIGIKNSTKRRPTSSKDYLRIKNKIFSSQKNQLFETFNQINNNIQKDNKEDKKLNTLKPSQMKLNDKKKFRNIIDKMMDKNLQKLKAQHTKIQHKKLMNSLQKQSQTRQFSKKDQSTQQIPLQKQKQNEINFQNINININIKPHTQSINMTSLNISKQLKDNKKFEFKNIKLNQINGRKNYRYANQNCHDQQSLTFNSQIQSNNYKLIHKSKESIDKQSIGKVSLKGTLPKILYPDSDSKLPSVFKSRKIRSSSSNSTNKRQRRISSANQTNNQIQTKNQLRKIQIPSREIKSYNNLCQINDPSMLLKCRPMSTFINHQNYCPISQENEGKSMNIEPKRLEFDNQQLTEKIKQKLNQKNNNTAYLLTRIGSRTKSTGNQYYAHRKLKQIQNFTNNHSKQVQFGSKNDMLKNISNQSRETAQGSSGVTLDSGDFMRHTGAFRIIDETSMACSLTFNIQK